MHCQAVVWGWQEWAEVVEVDLAFEDGGPGGGGGREGEENTDGGGAGKPLSRFPALESPSNESLVLIDSGLEDGGGGGGGPEDGPLLMLLFLSAFIPGLRGGPPLTVPGPLLPLLDSVVNKQKYKYTRYK